MILTTIIIIVGLAFFFYASYNIRSNIYTRVFCQKQTKEKIVAITFDDGPDSVETPRVLDVLKEYRVPACFFCIGSKIKGNEALLRRMVAEGHLVGNHSHTHSNLFPLYHYSKMKEDMQACQQELEKITEQPVNLFRPPFGVTNPTIAKAIRQLGYTPIGWNIRTLDTQHPTPEKVLRRIRQKLVPGSVILLHDRMSQSGLMLREVLGYIQKEGYTVVRLDSMLHE